MTKIGSLLVFALAPLASTACVIEQPAPVAAEVSSDATALSTFVSDTAPAPDSPEACYWRADPSMPATPTFVMDGAFVNQSTPAVPLINDLYGPHSGSDNWTL